MLLFVVGSGISHHLELAHLRLIIHCRCGWQVQGDNDTQLDLGAVQRGDAEMEQKMNRIIRACIEAGGDNPILSIHDQGAGGNGEPLYQLLLYQ